jgi:hypothetical protein
VVGAHLDGPGRRGRDLGRWLGRGHRGPGGDGRRRGSRRGAQRRRGRRPRCRRGCGPGGRRRAGRRCRGWCRRRRGGSRRGGGTAPPVMRLGPTSPPLADPRGDAQTQVRPDPDTHGRMRPAVEHSTTGISTNAGLHIDRAARRGPHGHRAVTAPVRHGRRPRRDDQKGREQDPRTPSTPPSIHEKYGEPIERPSAIWGQGFARMRENTQNRGFKVCAADHRCPRIPTSPGPGPDPAPEIPSRAIRPRGAPARRRWTAPRRTPLDARRCHRQNWCGLGTAPSPAMCSPEVHRPTAAA